MNKFNWEIVIAAVLTIFLSAACSKKIMPPEIETSNGGLASSDFTSSDGSSSKENTFGGSDDNGLFSEEPINEDSSSSMGSSRADGSSGSFDSNPFVAESSNRDADRDSDRDSDSGIQEARLNKFHATGDLKDIYFNFDKYGLDSNSKKILEENAQFLKNNPEMRVEIQGHSDERGTNNYNIALGERRAHSTKKFLVTQGVDPSKVNVISYGEEKPFCSNSNENCWLQNRRAHFMVAR